MDEVIPDIKVKWPRARRSRITLQNNAPGRRITDDPEVRAASSLGGWDIELTHQPPSPDTTIFDVGFLDSIQSLQDCIIPRAVDELVAEVMRTSRLKTATPLIGSG